MTENNKRQHSDSEDIVEAKKARNLECSDDVVDAKEVKHHDLSDSEGGDTSQEGEEEVEKEKKDILNLSLDSLSFKHCYQKRLRFQNFA